MVANSSKCELRPIPLDRQLYFPIMTFKIEKEKGWIEDEVVKIMVNWQVFEQ